MAISPTLMHYNNTVGLPGDISAVIARLLAARWAPNAVIRGKSRMAGGLRGKESANGRPSSASASRPRRCMTSLGQRAVLTQPAAIKIVADFAKVIDAAKFFDAGDVQANGFQIVEDDRTGDTFTETGASYMGFAVSALLAGAAADEPRYAIAFTGDGSFMMNPQILIDGSSMACAA